VTPEPHPLAAMLRAAAEGTFPPADLAVEVLRPPPGPVDAVVAFSGHNVIAAGVDPELVRANIPGDDPGAPMSAPFLTWLGERLGTPPGMADLVLVADDAGPPNGEGTPLLAPRGDLAEHPRLARARRFRTEVRGYSDPEGRALVITGRGLAGRLEVSVEVEPDHRGVGLGRAMAEAATALTPPGEPLFAQVSPGNVASVRAFLAARYRPVCGEVLFLTRPANRARELAGPGVDSGPHRT
jgi:GNAT superfamily N-acetyltransferase